jgi:hypothetical protein
VISGTSLQLLTLIPRVKHTPSVPIAASSPVLYSSDKATALRHKRIQNRSVPERAPLQVRAGTAGRGVDAVFDHVVGGGYLSKGLGCLASGGIYVAYGFTDSAQPGAINVAKASRRPRPAGLCWQRPPPHPFPMLLWVYLFQPTPQPTPPRSAPPRSISHARHRRATLPASAVFKSTHGSHRKRTRAQKRAHARMHARTRTKVQVLALFARLGF